MDDIESIVDIQRLAVQGFKDWSRYGSVNVRAQDDLLIFNYSVAAQFEARWNFFERVSRGLIVNARTGEIVARPFDKFFNWLEDGHRTSASIVTITDKIDGSLGILYRTATGYRLATRGSFTGKQANWATQFLQAHYDLTGLPEELTLLFEIVYPENRIVIDYQDRQDLVLLAARNRHTGAYLPFMPDVCGLAQRYGFSLPQVFTLDTIADILARTGAMALEQEGFVVEFSDGERFKFKGDRYLEIQRLIAGLTFNNVLQAMSSGSIQSILESVPDEFLGQVKLWMRDIETTVADIKTQVLAAFAEAPRESRKDFALWVQAHHRPLMHYLFAAFDGRAIEPIIYKTVDWQYEIPEES